MPLLGLALAVALALGIAHYLGVPWVQQGIALVIVRAATGYLAAVTLWVFQVAIGF